MDPGAPGSRRLIHTDYRLDNLLFATDDTTPPVTAVDWANLAVGLPARDVAFLLETGLQIEDRRAHERDLLAAYGEELRPTGRPRAALRPAFRRLPLRPFPGSSGHGPRSDGCRGGLGAGRGDVPSDVHASLRRHPRISTRSTSSTQLLDDRRPGPELGRSSRAAHKRLGDGCATSVGIPRLLPESPRTQPHAPTP